MRATLDWSYGLLDEPDAPACCGCCRSSSAASGSTDLEARGGAGRGSAEPSVLTDAGGARRAVAGGRRARAGSVAGCWSRSPSTPATGSTRRASGTRPPRAHAAHFLDRRRGRPRRATATAGRSPPSPGSTSSTPTSPPPSSGSLAAGDAATRGAVRLGAVDVLVAARPPRPRPPARRDASLAPRPARRRARPRAELAAATMSFAMDDVAAAAGVVVARPSSTRATTRSIRGQRGGRRGPRGARRRRPRRGPRPLRAGPAPIARRRRARGRVDRGRWRTSGSARSALLEGDADAAVGTDRGTGSTPPGGAGTGCRRTSRSTTSPRSSSAAATTPRPARHLEEGMRLSLETGDHANLAYLLDAAAVLEAADGHPRAGAAPARRRPGDPRDDRFARVRLLPARPGRDRGRRRPRPVRHLGADRYDDALDTGRGAVARARRPRCSGRPRYRLTPDPYTTRTPAHCPWCATPSGSEGGAAAAPVPAATTQESP